MKSNETQPIYQEYREEKQSQSSEKKKVNRGFNGMADRVPGAQNYESVWENLRQGQPGAKEVSRINTVQNRNDTICQAVANHVKEVIVEELSESLKVDINLIGNDESFEDYGLDALAGVHLVQLIGRDLMIELETTSIYGNSSVNQLTAYILARFNDQSTKISAQNTHLRRGMLIESAIKENRVSAKRGPRRISHSI